MSTTTIECDDLDDLLEQSRHGAGDAEALEREFPCYGLDAPGMPLPGPDFIVHAAAMGDNPPAIIAGKGPSRYTTYCGAQLRYLHRRSLYDGDFQMPVKIRGQVVQARFVPGHLLGSNACGFNGGPRRADVVVIGKHPGHEEIVNQKNFCGPTSAELFRAIERLGVPAGEINGWYFTNLVKFPQLDKQNDGIPTAWIRDCLPLLHEELRIIQPKYILCLGSHASKALLGVWAAVTNMAGRVEELRYPVYRWRECPRYHTAKVMAAVHPAYVYRRPELFEPFKDQLGTFLQLCAGIDVGAAERDIDHRVIYSENQLRWIVDEVRADPSRWLIAVDAEWHGEFPSDSGSYLRSVQFSTRHGEGICVVLRHQGGYPAFKPGISRAVTQLRRLLQADPEAGYYPRIGGHAFRADLPWLLHEGIDVRAEYAAPEHVLQARGTGGFETTLMYHATNEAASFALSDVAARLTTAPRYDRRLSQWKTEYCKVCGIVATDLEGYGMCPDWVLHPSSGSQMRGRPEHSNYACYDADAARRIAVRCLRDGGLLDADWFNESSWLPYWNAHRASLAFLEMETNGIKLDRDRVEKLSTVYQEVRFQLLTDFRKKIHWPDFNPDSAPQCAAFLFGDRYSYKLDPNGNRLSRRPVGAATLGLTPIKSTGKRGKAWDAIVAKGEEDEYTPSTDKETLGILGHHYPLVMQLRDIKFINQCLKYVLRPPDQTAGGLVRDAHGNLIYSRGLASFVREDGKIHTHMSQLKETGRGASARPPLQNLSKRREDDYARILGVLDLDENGVQYIKGDYAQVLSRAYYKHPVRSILCADPGWVLVEADYVGAELAVIAWLAGDPVMIDHVQRNTLPEDDPNHYDIHSQTAVKAFQLDCLPTKTAIKKAGKKGLRVAAKNVNFGIPYGRMAPAIARQCREEGTVISEEDTQRLIDYYFGMYRRTIQFLAECRQRVEEPKWLCTPYGRRRRFVQTCDRMVLGEQERQAQNFPIQSTVADAVNRALATFLSYRRHRPQLRFRILLQIHDAILFMVPISELGIFLREVLPECMIRQVPIWPTRLDGTLVPGVDKPYYFGIETEVQINWGESISKAQAASLGIPLELI
jgi:uracil-DNA glycosylase family 4